MLRRRTVRSRRRRKGPTSTGRTPSTRATSPATRRAPTVSPVIDNVTGLMWQQSPDTNGDGVINRADKMTWEEVQTYPAIAQRQEVRRLRRLASADHQGDVLAHPVRRHRPEPDGARRHRGGPLPRHALLLVRLRQPGGGGADHRLAVRLEHALRLEDHGRRRHAVRGQLRRRPHQGLRPPHARRERQEVRRPVRAGQPGLRQERLRRQQGRHHHRQGHRV